MSEGVKSGDDWYYFDNNRWIKSNGLWCQISNELVNKYSFLEVEDEVKSQINKLTHELKTVGFKSSLIKECTYMFNSSDPDFSKKLDENASLMCFKNGVLDLSNGVSFRNGKPRDYITLSTGYDYTKYDPSDQNTKDVLDYLEKVFVDKPVREYVLKTLASCLLGGSDEHFHIWTGLGSNAKSKTIELIEKTLGDYASKIPISLLTNKRAASGNASPEVIRTRGRRFVSMQEPENDETLKVGLLKELTGRDKIVARELYKNSVEFMPQFKMFLCCNDLPPIPADDYGTWRRVRVVEFKSKFTDSPREGNKYEFEKDHSLHLKMENWKSSFMSILVEYYKKVLSEGIKEPEEVLKYTNKYKNENDTIEVFIESELLETTYENSIPSSELWETYTTWCKQSNIKNLTKLQFNKKLNKKFPKGAYFRTKDDDFKLDEN